MPFLRRRPTSARRRPRGTKGRRRTELGLLVMAAFIVVATYSLMIVGNTHKAPADVVPLILAMLGMAFAAHVANRVFVPDAHPVVLPIVFLLNGMGYVMLTRIDLAGLPQGSNFAPLQAAWTAVGVGAYIATVAILRRSRDLDRFRYLLLAVAVALLLAPLVPHLGVDINGARLWVKLGPIQFQPIEIAKILLCIFLASYFADKRELLTVPTARIGNRLVVDPRPLIPIGLAWVFAMGIIGLEDDIGFSALLFTVFIGMLWVTTGRAFYLVVGVVLFLVGAYVAAKYFGQVHIRVSTWIDPWKTPLGHGEQLVRSWYALGSGGIGGTGLGLGLTNIPVIQADYIFALIGEEMGLLGSTMVVVAFLLLVGTGLRIAQTARSEFAKLAATGLTLVLGFQAFFIMAGILRLLPLTGLTLPFVSYGGSALVANYVLVAILMRISDEGNAAEDAAERAALEEPDTRAIPVLG